MDKHHFLFTDKEWSTGLAKTLREHPYCGVMVPKFTLHPEVHAKVRGVPVPPDFVLREVLTQLEVLEHYGGISYEDSAQERLETLIVLFGEFAPLTANALKEQLAVFRRRM